MMDGERAACLSPEFWNRLMGRDLAAAKAQPLQPVRIENGKLTLFAGPISDRFQEGTKIGLCLHGSRIHLEETPDGRPMPKSHFWDEGTFLDLKLSGAARNILPQGEPVLAMLVDCAEHVELVPIRVQEHDADVLGPRVIDQLEDPPDETSPPTLVRHLVRGYGCEEWTPQRLEELEDLICATPFRHDPLKELAAGDDWVAWKTRNEILRQPGGEDERVRQELVSGIFAGQTDNGSWDNAVMPTAYGILRALSVDVPAEDQRLRKAAQWLLEWPQPAGRPGMWMQSARHLREWNAIQSGEVQAEHESYLRDTVGDEQCGFVRAEAQQQVVPTCARHYSGLCDAMLHASGTVAYALCRCGYPDHPRVRDYANSMLQLGGMFGYFCACWGIVDFGTEVEHRKGEAPDFNQRTEEHEIALKSLAYGYARDAVDLCVPARRPHYPRVHRPDLADTNGWVPYDWKDIGDGSRFALVGTYWQNADCWAKANRGLCRFAPWSGSIAEFFAVFQAHLYQTTQGEWPQGFPAGVLRLIAEATSTTRAGQNANDSPAARLARVILLKSVPWLREHQSPSGLWDHGELSRFGGGERFQPLSPRLATYHIASVLNEFGLLARLRCRAAVG